MNNFKQKCRDYETKLVKESNDVRCYRFNEVLLNELAAVISSYLGHFKMANSWNLWQALWKRFDYLAQYFEFDANKWRLIRKYPVPHIKRVRGQYRYFRWRFSQDIVFMRVGKFIEFYGIITSPWLECLGLQAMGWNRRGARYGFPVKQLWQKLTVLLVQGYEVLIISEQVSALGGVRKRVPICRFCLAND